MAAETLRDQRSVETVDCDISRFEQGDTLVFSSVVSIPRWIEETTRPTSMLRGAVDLRGVLLRLGIRWF
jgi:hypothetical protein